MICIDERIVNICAELLTFLKSDEEETILHSKTIKRTQYQNSAQTDIAVGFLNIKMVWKPYSKINETEIGSDEGASVFITLPFREDERKGADAFEVQGYYSERGTKRKLTVIVADQYKPNPMGTRRIATKIEITNTNPLT